MRPPQEKTSQARILTVRLNPKSPEDTAWEQAKILSMLAEYEAKGLTFKDLLIDNLIPEMERRIKF